jgi:acyl carrier protein
VNHVTERLCECFREVFPELADDQIETAVRADMSEWDSLAALTLLTVVEEAFGVELDDDDVAKLTSFASMLNVVEQVGV